MNIEDKIKEIAKKNCKSYFEFENDGGSYEVSSYEDCYDSAMQMHEWDKEYYNKLLDLLVKSGADANIITDYIKNCIEL